jgi:putative transposase
MRYGTPDISNLDRGAELPPAALTDVPGDEEIKISKGRDGRWLDNVFVEWLWRSVTYEEV